MLIPQTNGTSSQFQSLKVCSQPTFGSEYIELYNSNPCDSFDLSCYFIGFNNANLAQNNGTFRFPIGTKIPPLGFVSIGGPNSGATFNLTSFCTNAHLNTGGDRWFLPNGDGYLMLWNSNGIPVDAVYWTFNANEANKWGTDNDIQFGPTFIAAGVTCPSVSTLTGPSGLSSSSAIVSYAGQAPSIGNVIHRVSDGGSTWSRTGIPTINACNGTCAIPSNLNVQPIITNASCGLNNGAINLTVSAGTAPYTFVWSNGSSTEDLSGLTAGNFSVTVTDANSCNRILTASVSSSSSSTVSVSNVSNVSCNGGNNGSVDISANFNPICSSNSIRINEVLTDVQGAGPQGDGTGCGDSINPLSAEYIELIGPPGANIGCFVLTDGDWTITIPAGTTIPADGFFTIGNNNTPLHLGNGTVFDLNVNACQCFTDSCQLMIFTNPGEYLAMFNSSGTFVDGLIYGSPTGTNIPVAGTVIPTRGLSTCVSSVTLPAISAFTVFGTQPTEGFSLVRLPDGSGSYFSSTVNSPNACNSTAAPSFTYVWSNGATTQDLSALTAGNYTVTATDLYGCPSIVSVTVTQPSVLSATLSSIPAACANTTNGSATAVVSGGTPSYRYSWSNGRTTSNNTALLSGVYTVTITDANNCSITRSVTISSPPAINVNLSATNSSCSGNTGTASVISSGGNAPYTYLWSNGSTLQNLTGLAAGSYTVTVTDASSCTASNLLVVSSNSSTTVTLSSVVNNTCNGNSNGSIDISVQSPVVPCSSPTVVINEVMYRPDTLDGNGANPLLTGEYIELIGPPGTNIGCYVLSDGDWTITIPPGTIIPADGIFTIGHNASPYAIRYGITYDLNVGGCACFVSATAGNGILIFTNGGEYLALFNGAGNFIDGLLYGIPSAGNTPPSGASTTAAGVINTIGLAGCQSSVTIPSTGYLTHPGNLAANTSLVRNPDGTGTWTSQVGGSVNSCNFNPTLTSTYLWSNGATTEDISALTAGVYTVTVTNSSGCPSILSVTVTEPSAITATLNPNQVSCFGQNNGSISSILNGGNAPYTYSWSNGSTSATNTGLVAGNYTVTVRDLNSCSATASVSVSQPNALTAAIAAGNAISCNGGTNGTATAAGSGGTGSFSYIWSNGQNTAISTGLSSGTYSVTVRDLNSCSVTQSITISEPTAVSVTGVVNNIACTSANIGAVNTNASGGTAGYQYNWSNGSTTQNISGLAAGSYSLTVADANNCTATYSATVISTPGLQIIPIDDQVSCFGASDACANVTVNGGVAPYSYQWANGETSSNICNLPAGTYVLTVTDASGGSGTSIDTVYQENFQGVNNWTLNVSTGTNGADNNFWVVNDNEGGVLPPGCGIAGNGDRTLHITSVFFPAGGAAYDAGGLCGLLFCPETNRRAESPVFSTVGFNNLTLKFDFISNGQALIDNASVFYNSGAGWTQLVNSIKSNVCGSGQGEWTNFTIALPAACNNNPTVQIGFNWTNNDDGIGTDPSVAINNIVVYNTGSGTTACSGVDTVNITEPQVLQTTLQSIVNPSCYGSSNGQININVAGGTAPYNYNWSNGQNTQNISALGSGSYNVTVEDAAGCQIFLPVNILISEPAELLVSNLSLSDAGCNLSNGSINFSASGGTTPYSYQWSNGLTSQNLINVFSGNYFLTVTDANGCILSGITATVNSVGGPSVQVDSITNESCIPNLNGSAGISVSAGTPSYNFQWSNGSSTEDLNNVGPGIYTLTVTDANSCTASVSVSIASPIVPSANAYIGQVGITDSTIFTGESIIVAVDNNQTAQGVSYQWTSIPSNLNFTTSNAVFTDLSTTLSGNYVIVVTATSADGCTDIDTLLLTVLDFDNPEIPTAFSPNGDNVNDLFQVVNLNKEYLQEFKIYNRWGQLVYDDANQAVWDGRVGDILQPRDVYMYVISWKRPVDTEIVLKRGSLTLMR